jgi:hypothetical protein
MSKTRLNRCAQVSGAVGGSLQSPRESAGAHGRVAGGAAGSLWFLRWRAWNTSCSMRGEVDAGAWYERGKAGDKVGWTGQEVGGAVAERVLQLVDHLAGGIR